MDVASLILQLLLAVAGKLCLTCKKSDPKYGRRIFLIYSNKKETSDFYGTVSFNPVKISQQE